MLHKLKSGIKNGNQVTLNLSSNMVGDSNDETKYLNKWFLNNVQISSICKAFANGSSANIKFSTTHLSIMIPLGEFIGLPGIPFFRVHKIWFQEHLKKCFV